MPPVKQLGPRVTQKRKQKYTRSKSGCFTCRKRRVKCDQRKPICEKCADLDRECVWTNEQDVKTPYPLPSPPQPETASSHSEQPVESTEGQVWDLDHPEPGSIFDLGNEEYSFLDWLVQTPTASTPAAGPARVPPVNGDEDTDVPQQQRPTQLPPATLPTPPSTAVIPFQTPNYQTTTLFPAITATTLRPNQIMPVIPTSETRLSGTLSQSTLAKRRTNASEKAESPISFDAIFPLLQALDPYYQAFPTPTNRELFNHFLQSTSRIIVALDAPHRNNNPFVSVALPLALSDGVSVARDGARHALLSLTAAHQHHQHRETSQVRSVDMLRASAREKRLATASMISNVAINFQADIDFLLATCMILKTRDILLADQSWRTNLDFAMRLIQRHGGPEALLSADPKNFSRRFIVEQLTMTDIISTFSTGHEPTLLNGRNEWWFEFEKHCSTSKEWEAFETQFGISRQTSEIMSRARQLTYYNEHIDTSDPASTAQSALGVVKAQAWAVLEELSNGSISQLFVPKRTRVASGDSAYRYCISIMLLTEILGFSPTDDRVQTSVKSLLEVCAEMSIQPVMLIWPLLYAGANAVTEEDRAWTKSLFGTYAYSHCSDLIAADDLLQAQWAKMDQGEPFTPWHRLMEAANRQVLLI